MRKHAFLDVNKMVLKVAEISEEQWLEEIKNYIMILDVHDENIDIKEGWHLTSDGWSTAQEYVVPVPLSVTPRQFRLALIRLGTSLADIEHFIETLPEPMKSVAKVTWEYSTDFQRTNPVLNQLAPQIGMTSEDLDNIFRLASTL